MERERNDVHYARFIEPEETDRFHAVNHRQKASHNKKYIFSSVPQGGKLSAPLWDFDMISELGDKLSAELVPFGHADDAAL